jgi:hypothetical protein
MSAQLLARLGAANPYRVTLLCGPPGSGKTEAIALVLEGMRARRVHFGARHPHAELIPFVRGLVDALAPTVPALGVGFASAAATANRSARPALVLSEWFAQHLGQERAIIALDDLHVLGDATAVRDFIVRAIAVTAPDVRWLLGSRDTHSWPRATWLANSVAGVPLALDSDRHAASLSDDGVAAAARAWLATLDVAQAASARAVALLPSLDAAYVARIPDAGAVLAGLAQTHPYACSGDRLRAAFAEALVSPASAFDSDAFALARIALQNAPAATRLQFFSEMRAGEAILELVNRDGFALIDAHKGDIVERAVSELALDERRTCALAILLEATRETELGRHDVAESWYLHAARIAPDAPSRARVEFEFGSDLLRRARLDCIETLERVTACSVTPSFDARATAALGTAYAAADRWESARVMIADALARVASWPEDEDVAVRARVYRQAAYVFLLDADPGAAAAFARRAIDLGERWGLDEIVAAALSVLLVVASSHEDDGEANLALLQRLERCAHRLDNAFLLRYARLGELEAYGERAAWPEVDRMETVLASQELENDTLHTDETLVRTRALRAAGVGDFAGALRLLRTAGDHVGDAELRAFHQAEIATYAAAAGDHGVAIRAMAEVAKILPSLPPGANALVVRTEMQLTLAHFLLGFPGLTHARLRRAAPLTARFPRVQRLYDTVSRVLAFADDRADTSGTAMLESLAALHACGLGAIASMIGALPLSIVARRRS